MNEVPAGTSLPPDTLFRKVLGVVFLVMSLVLIAQPKLLLRDEKTAMCSEVLAALIFFAIGLYAGFLQAGVGVLLLPALVLVLGRDLVAANGMKNFLVLIYTIPALAVFAFEEKIDWTAGLTLAAGNAAGGYIGARLAIRRGTKLIFAFLLAVMILTGARLLVAF